MCIRFVVGSDGEHHRSLTGIITEARILRDEGELDGYQVSRLQDAYRWLNANLPCPPFESANWPSNAVSWFKDEAGQPLKYMWDIASLLREHGIPIRMLRSAHPGKILYEDSFQIVVEEWRKL